MRRLAVIGSLARDSIDGRAPEPGGAPLHAGRALRLLGRPGTIITRCAGADRAALLPRLVSLGIPVAWRDTASTVAFDLAYDGEHRSMRVRRLGDEWTPRDARGWVARALGRATWLHVAPLLRSEFPAPTLEELARGRRLSLDGQGLVRVPELGPLRLDAAYDSDLLRHVDVLKLAEDEAAVLVKGDERSFTDLGVPEVVVTRGSRGCTVIAGGRVEHVRAHPLRVDPTGAGDAFAVGYLAGRSDGLTPVGAARRATALVAEILRRRA